MVDGHARITVRIAFEILCALDAGARERNKPLLALGRAEEQTKFIVNNFLAIEHTHRIILVRLCRSGFLQRLVETIRPRAAEAAVLIRIC